MCGETKHVTEFVIVRGKILDNGWRSGNGLGNRSKLCKQCKRKQNDEYYKRNKEKVNAAWVAKNAVVAHYGVDEKFGETWKELDAALSMCRMTTPLQKAA